MRHLEYWLHIHAIASQLAGIDGEHCYVGMRKRYTEIALYAEMRIIRCYLKALRR